MLPDYQLNAPPFNPDYDPSAKDGMTLAVHQCYLNGVYELRQEDRAPLIAKEYETQMKRAPFQGKKLKSLLIIFITCEESIVLYTLN
jgi:hypothetical protein